MSDQVTAELEKWREANPNPQAANDSDKTIAARTMRSVVMGDVTVPRSTGRARPV